MSSSTRHLRRKNDGHTQSASASLESLHKIADADQDQDLSSQHIKPEDTTNLNRISGDNDEQDDGEYSENRLTRRATLSKTYSRREEKEIIKKFDTKLVRFLAILYLLSFLDRSNIGNARVAGMETALKMSSKQFDFCLIAFYVTYITFEWMIMLYKLIPPHIYISLCVFSWGVIASLQSCVTSVPQLLILRALLGVTEAAFGPGVPFYMTFFYRREELAYRVGLQIAAAPLATAFASAIAWVIIKLNVGTGLEDWRALFLFEGAPSIVVAWIAWYWIPDSPSTARWLTSREKKIAALRLQDGTSDSSPSVTKKTSKSSIISANKDSFLTSLITTLSDPKSWLTALMFLSVNVSFASLPVFLPTIINSMSFSPLTSQILASPPYLLAFIFVLFMGRYSDRTPNSRGKCLCGTAGLSCISYSIIAIAGLLHHQLGERLSIAIRYIAVYPAAMGLFASVVLIITWTLNNQQNTTGKGLGMVVLNVVGQCGPLIGVQLFPKDQGPMYVQGMFVCAAFMAGVIILSAGLRWWLSVLNVKIQSDVYEMTESSDGNGAGVFDEEQEGLVPGSNEIGRRKARFHFML